MYRPGGERIKPYNIKFKKVILYETTVSETKLKPKLVQFQVFLEAYPKLYNTRKVKYGKYCLHLVL